MAIFSARHALRGVVALLSATALSCAARAQANNDLQGEFRQAERLFWLDNWVKARDLYAYGERSFAGIDPAKALICKFSRLRADAETNLSYYRVSKLISTDLETQTARFHPEVRLRGLIVKAAADLSIRDPVLSGQEWEEAERLAHTLKEEGWEARAKGELGIVAYLQGDTAKAVALNTEYLLTAKKLNDVAGMIRALSLKGVGLLERNAADQAVAYFDQALDLARANPDVRFPLMAYMGKSQALEAQGDGAGAARLLAEANQFVETIGMTVYKADLAIALGVQAEKRGSLAQAEEEFDQACRAATLSHMPRPFADAMFHKIELRQRQSNWSGAEHLIPAALKADRELIDIQFLPQHLGQAAEIEIHIGNIERAREYLSQANDVIEAALARAPSPSIERSLIATMSNVFVEQFELALNQDRNLPKAFAIVENARSRVIARHLRSSDYQAPIGNTRARVLNAEIARIQLNLVSSAYTPRERSRSLQSLAAAESELETVQLAQHRPLHGGRTVPLPLSVIQDTLSPDELIIEYVVGDKNSFALAITKEFARAYELPKAKDLDVLVSGYTQEVVRTDSIPEESRHQARRLFDAVLGPIAELEGKKRVIIVPDGGLDSVAFESLTDQHNQYFIRSHIVSYIPSATLLHILRNRPTNSGAPYSILAFAAPELPRQLASTDGGTTDVTRALLDIHGGRVPRLRSASGEVRVIASELGGSSQLFLSTEATEARFKSEPLTRFRVIHFATHAFADVHYPERSAIVLAPDPSTGDDGLLQVREIRSLNLRADLVTLSACDAGAGRAEGIQGLESLVSAFQFAGARSVLASRWETDDTFAASLMTDVYRELATGVSIVDAVRHAQLEALKKYGTAARPSLWSAFFVSGEPNTKIHEQSVQPKQR
jgi:CHAT domain-containing protein